MIDTNQSVEALQKQVYDLQQDLIHFYIISLSCGKKNRIMIKSFRL